MPRKANGTAITLTAALANHIVRRLKGSTESSSYVERDEHKALGDLLRANAKKGVKSDYVFLNERNQPFGRMGVWTLTPFSNSRAPELATSQTSLTRDIHDQEHASAGLNQANTVARVLDAPRDQLGLQVCICRWTGTRIRCIGSARP
jgi:hypothetical protein